MVNILYFINKLQQFVLYCLNFRYELRWKDITSSYTVKQEEKQEERGSCQTLKIGEKR